MLGDIEGALGRHFALMSDAMEKKDTDAGVRKEIDRLEEAIYTINEIMRSRGRARHCSSTRAENTAKTAPSTEIALYDEGDNFPRTEHVRPQCSAVLP